MPLSLSEHSPVITRENREWTICSLSQQQNQPPTNLFYNSYIFSNHYKFNTVFVCAGGGGCPQLFQFFLSFGLLVPEGWESLPYVDQATQSKHKFVTCAAKNIPTKLGI